MQFQLKKILKLSFDTLSHRYGRIGSIFVTLSTLLLLFLLFLTVWYFNSVTVQTKKPPANPRANEMLQRDLTISVTSPLMYPACTVLYVLVFVARNTRDRAAYGFAPSNYTAYTESALLQIWILENVISLSVSVSFYVVAVAAIILSKQVGGALKGKSTEQRLLLCCFANFLIFIAVTLYRRDFSFNCKPTF